MKSKRAAVYVRVSTGEQKTDAQEYVLRKYVEDRGWVLQKIYRDHGISGITTNRPGLDDLMRDARRRAFDVLVVFKFDRFARSLKTLLSGLEFFRSLNIDFVSLTEPVDTSLPSGELVFQIFGAVAQFERALIGERVKAGLEHALSKGKVLGRRPLRVLHRSEIAQLRKDRREQRLPFRTLAEKYRISVWTAHSLCKRKAKHAR